MFKIGLVRFTIGIVVTAMLSFSLGRSYEYAANYAAHSTHQQVQEIMAMLP